jgi:hypothetical protein
MKKLKLLNTPTKLSKLRFDDLEYDAAPLREAKMDQLRIRRWRKLRNRMGPSQANG